jgi:hypothetical protein
VILLLIHGCIGNNQGVCIIPKSRIFLGFKQILGLFKVVKKILGISLDIEL